MDVDGEQMSEEVLVWLRDADGEQMSGGEK